MSLLSERSFFRLALVGVLAVSFGLAACGRKGPLDPPPGASLDGGAKPEQSPSALNPIAMQPFGSGGGSERPEPPKGPDKSIPLDVLLN